MERLPDASGFPSEFVVAREQRNGYDHAVRAAGARLVEVGFHEVVAGAGVRRAEAWEFAAALGPMTAGVLYVHDAEARPPLPAIVEVAHARGLPVLVDAAGELPPRANLRGIIAAGADLVVFSGGKAIRGPQGSAILAGRRDLIDSVRLQTLDMDVDVDSWIAHEGAEPPHHGLGRSMKIGKEQIVGLVVALQEFVARDHERDADELHDWLDSMLPTVTSDPARIATELDFYPRLVVTVGRERARGLAQLLAEALPPIIVPMRRSVEVRS
jgi:L-seryl-tRNA(Ser) seleniumtransferase